MPDLPAATGVQALSIPAGHGVQNQERAALGSGLAVQRLEQCFAHALPPRAAVDQHLGHIGAVWLVVGHIQDELHGPDDPGLVVFGHHTRVRVAAPPHRPPGARRPAPVLVAAAP